jgi:molecular chaperone GrpE (heat shock protein)
MPNWFYYDDGGQKLGPITDKQLQELAVSGKVTRATKLETEDGKTGPAEKLKGLFPESVPPEPAALESIQELPVDEPGLSVAPETADQAESLSTPEPTDEPTQDIPEQTDVTESSADCEMPVSESTSDVAERVLSELQPILVALNEKVESQTKEAEFLNQLVTKKQEQIDKLYNENQEYKQGIHEKLKKSLVLAVIGQIDAAQKTISHFENHEFSEENYRKLLDNYNEIARDFQDSLAQSFDVVAFSSEENATFDPKRQKALKTVPTQDETKNKKITKSLRPGYEMTNGDGPPTLLRPEQVEVYVHQPSQS